MHDYLREVIREMCVSALNRWRTQDLPIAALSGVDLFHNLERDERCLRLRFSDRLTCQHILRRHEMDRIQRMFRPNDAMRVIKEMAAVIFMEMVEEGGNGRRHVARPAVAPRPVERRVGDGYEWVQAEILYGWGVLDAGVMHFTRTPISPEAEARAMTLLNEHLTDKQHKQKAAKNAFTVKGGDTGKTYRIQCENKSFNVQILGALGVVKGELCFTTRGAYPLGDKLLTQKLALECDEAATLRIANHRNLAEYPF